MCDVGKEKTYSEEYFDGKGYGYGGYTAQRFLGYHELLAKCLNEVLSPRKVLDIGCSKGFLVLAFHRLGIDSYGLDISSYAVSKSPLKIRNKLSVLNIEKDKIPFPDDYFDLVTMLGVIEHLQDFEFPLKEIKRVLKPGGFFFMITPDANPEKDPKGIHINVNPSHFWLDALKRKGLITDDETLIDIGKKIRKYRESFVKQIGNYIKHANRLPASVAEILVCTSARTSAFFLYVWAWIYYENLLYAILKCKGSTISKIIALTTKKHLTKEAIFISRNIKEEH
jgi:SAM-dependent methyltransferase